MLLLNSLTTTKAMFVFICSCCCRRFFVLPSPSPSQSPSPLPRRHHRYCCCCRCNCVHCRSTSVAAYPSSSLFVTSRPTHRPPPTTLHIRNNICTYLRFTLYQLVCRFVQISFQDFFAFIRSFIYPLNLSSLKEYIKATTTTNVMCAHASKQQLQ